jgi:hypothetical protein
MSKDLKTLISIIGFGCAGLCIMGVIVLVFAGSTLFNGFLDEPEDVVIDVNVPLQAQKGNRIMFTVTVQNTSSDSQVLDSIDISTDYLSGVPIEDSQPKYIEDYPIPLVEYHSFTFQQSIGPGETLVVQFFGFALKSGDFSGPFDVCIGTGSNCSTFTGRTVISN